MTHEPSDRVGGIRARSAGLDWRIAAVALFMAAAFAGAIVFPELIPYALIWAAVIAAAAFVRPRAAAGFAVYGLALSVIGGVVSDNADSKVFWVRMVAYVVIGIIAVLLSRQRTRREEVLLDRATTDELTGLATRRLLVERLEAQMEVRDRDSASAVLYADLDSFKEVNDSLGHAAGDDVLRHASERLLACTRTPDTVARFGGDEFVIACPSIEGIDGVTAMCERILAAFESPIRVRNTTVSVGITIGAAIALPGVDVGPAALIDSADRALLACKQDSPGSFRIAS